MGGTVPDQGQRMLHGQRAQAPSRPPWTSAPAPAFRSCPPWSAQPTRNARPPGPGSMPRCPPHPAKYSKFTASKLQRRNAVAGRIYVTDLATGRRRDLTFEEERAFWGWATIEILAPPASASRNWPSSPHHSFVAYKLPSTGEIVPMLQIVPSKTDVERLLLVAPELGEVLAEIIHRVRQGRATLPLVAAYDPYERVWNPPAPLLFQCPRGPAHRARSRTSIRRYLNHLLAVSGPHRCLQPTVDLHASRLPTAVCHRCPPLRSAAAHRRKGPRPPRPRDDAGICRGLLGGRRHPPSGLHRAPTRAATGRRIPRPLAGGMGPVPQPLRAAQGRPGHLHPRLRHAVLA